MAPLDKERIGKRNPDNTLEWPSQDLWGREYSRHSPLSTIGIGKGQFVVVMHMGKKEAERIEELRTANEPKSKAKAANGTDNE